MQFETNEKQVAAIGISGGKSLIVTKKEQPGRLPNYNVHDVSGPFLDFVQCDLSDTVLVEHLLRRILDLDTKVTLLTEELKVLKKPEGLDGRRKATYRRLRDGEK